MRRPLVRFVVGSLLALGPLALGACRDEPTPPGPPDPVVMPPASVDTVAVPVDTVAATRPGILRIEGTETPVTLVRFDDPAAPFTAYLPDRLVPSTGGDATETTVRLDGPGGSAALFHFPRRRVGVDSLRRYAFTTMAAEQALTFDETPNTPCLWADEGRFFVDDEGTRGFACVGRYPGGAFLLTAVVPGETAEGFGARLDVALDELRWRDGGARLRTGRAAPVL